MEGLIHDTVGGKVLRSHEDSSVLRGVAIVDNNEWAGARRSATLVACVSRTPVPNAP